MSVSTVSDIFNRPPAISEDTLQYALYPRDDLNDRVSVTTLAALMRSYVATLLPDILWHRDAFELKVAEDEDGQRWLLEGRMRVGDCVDDEWCAVWLLKELSAKWDVAISVFDSDGEFLLIEAAEALPSWVAPNNAGNRVWIYQSRLHLIPLSHVSAPSSKPCRRRYPRTKDSDDEGDLTQDDDDDYISVADALAVVRDPLIDTFTPSAVEQLVWKRISGYPAATRQHIHVAKAYLPVDIAQVLAVDPSLIQKPIETFYTRDVLQLRAAHKMSRFPPEPSVLTSVKMTRTAYAQLMGQKFFPPKVFGRWQEAEGTQEWKWRDIGMKIACGFEMTFQESKGRSDATRISLEAMKSSAAGHKETLKRNPEYIKYIRNLVSSGYFRGELEGSQFWNELEDNAVEAFLEARREDDASRHSFAAALNTALSRAGNVSVPTVDEEDSDDWLNVDADTFDSMLRQNFGIKDLSNAADVDEASSESAEGRATKQATRLREFAKKVEEFVEGEGDVEGARFADEQTSDEESSDDDEGEDIEEHHAAVTQPPTSMDSAEQARRQAAMDSLVPPLDASEYGKMPASYYVNSQKVAPTTMETEMRDDISSQSSAASGSEPRRRPIRPPIISRDEYDGVDSDDETDEEDGEEDEEEEDKPQIVGDIEVDMEDEEEEFLEFARQALGVSNEQWNDIIQERKDRGAYVPSQVVAENKPKRPASTSYTKDVDGATFKNNHACAPMPGPRSNANPNLDSFEAVMQAMDGELARMRSSRDPTDVGETRAADKGKGKTKATADQNVDIEAAMDAELRGALEIEQNGDDDGDREDLGMGLDYNLIKNFLESFKSQGGVPGPVGNLAGKLQPGWTLPRDEA